MKENEEGKVLVENETFHKEQELDNFMTLVNMILPRS